MKNIHNDIAQSLTTHDTEVNRKRWAQYILEHNIPLDGFLAFMHGDKKTITRLAWMMGGLSETHPSTVFPMITPLFAERHSIHIKNFDRSLAKWMSLCGIPKEIEGEAVDQLFKWLLNPTITVSTKNFAMDALWNFCRLNPEIKPELESAIEDQLLKNTNAFEKRAWKLLEQIRKT